MGKLYIYICMCIYYIYIHIEGFRLYPSYRVEEARVIAKEPALMLVGP